jgi:hypothetical protein
VAAFPLLVGIVGAAFTLLALVRLLAAQRARAPRELLLGWLALMILGAIATFLLLRVV